MGRDALYCIQKGQMIQGFYFQKLYFHVVMEIKLLEVKCSILCLGFLICLYLSSTASLVFPMIDY